MASLSNVSPGSQVPDVAREYRPQGAILKTWLLDGKNVHLVRSGDQLSYELEYPFEVLYGSINLPSNTPIDKAIATLLELQPVVDEENSVTFVRKDREPEPIQRPEPYQNNQYLSQLDNESLIDENHWGVTLVNNVVSTNKNWKLIGGHANLFIETVVKSVYSIFQAHLVRGDEKGIGEVDLKKISFDPDRVASKSVTWVRSREKVQGMINQIENEKSNQESGQSFVPMDLRGKGGGFGWFRSKSKVHNCYTWAREKLEAAGIRLFKDDKLKVAILPKSHIVSDSLRTREMVQLNIEYSYQVAKGYTSNLLDSGAISEKDPVLADVIRRHGYGSVEFSEYLINRGILKTSNQSIDLTELIESHFGGIPWKIVNTDDSSRPIASFRGIYDGRNDFHPTSPEPITISIKAQGKDVRTLDLTEIVKDQMKSIEDQKQAEMLRRYREKYPQEQSDLPKFVPAVE